jgi:hypothetical protein
MERDIRRGKVGRDGEGGLEPGKGECVCVRERECVCERE